MSLLWARVVQRADRLDVLQRSWLSWRSCVVARSRQSKKVMKLKEPNLVQSVIILVVGLAMFLYSLLLYVTVLLRV